MHVCYVTHRYPPQSGGIETHVEQLATRLLARGHDVTVVAADARETDAHDPEGRPASRDDGDTTGRDGGDTTGRDGGDTTRRDNEHTTRDDGVEVHRVPAFAPGGNVYAAPGIVPAVWRVVRGVDSAVGARPPPDVVHVHNYHAVPFVLGGLTAWLATDARLVVTPHYHAGSDDASRDKLLTLYRPFGAATLARADRVIAVSDWERRQLEASFGVDATVVPNGVVRERFDGAAGSDQGDAAAGESRPYLLTVGRLEQYKGVQHVVSALPELPAYDLRVAGSGAYGERLREHAAEAGVSDRVEFLGYVDDDQLPGLYADAAAHVTLSTHEAYGMTVAESLAAGTPVVVREAGALVDWTTTTGVVGLDDPSPSVVADAVRRAVGGPSPDPTAVPTWETVTDELLAVYTGRSDAGVSGAVSRYTVGHKC